MPQPHSAPKPAVRDAKAGIPSMLDAQREMIAKRIADAPAAWLSIPMWGRVFTTTRKLLRIHHRGWSGR